MSLYGALLPQILLILTTLFILSVKIITRDQVEFAYVALIGILLSMGAFGLINPGQTVSGFTVDWLGMFSTFLLYVTAFATICYSLETFKRRSGDCTEWIVLLLLATIGLSVMASTYHLLMLFLGLEMASLALYVLCGYYRNSRQSLESSLKYFIQGSVGSAVFLLGLGLLFAHQQTLVINQATFVPEVPSVTYWISLLVVVASLAFKLSLIPFHLWVPDVYEGAPTPITGFMSVAVKLAVLTVFIRFLSHVSSPESFSWSTLIAVLATLTIIGGNMLALVQESVKRMLAYSSIAHAGYLSLGLVAGTVEGYSAILFYLAIYLVMNLAAFGIIESVAGESGNYSYERFHGLSMEHPGLAIALAVCMISLSGLPPTAGFMGKLMLFYSVVGEGYTWLALVAVAGSLISVAFYFKVIVHSYLKEANLNQESKSQPGWIARSLSVACMIYLIVLGVIPGKIYDMIGAIARLTEGIV
ncbi:MAG: NADH-quinone oxidoreductase subunit N [bacterium]